MTNFVVTTNVKTNFELEQYAREIAYDLNVKFINRNKLTIKELINKHNNVLVVYKNELIYFNSKNEKLFFHLDTAMVRIKNNKEPLLDIISEKNQNILDITMGLARDSVVLSYFGHNVTALEENKIIHYIVNVGLKNYNTKNNILNDALRKIKTHNIDNLKFLQKCKNNEYDIIYLDPMFNKKIKDSNNLLAIEELANKSILTEKLFTEILRVAKKKIIIKAHNSDKVFEKFNFTKITRPGAKFSFGFVNVSEEKFRES